MPMPSASRGSRRGPGGEPATPRWFLAELGDFAEPQRAAEITMRDRDTIAGHPWNLVNTSWQIAWAYVLQGDLDRAKLLADQAIELCRQWGFSRALSGRAAEAVELLEEGLRRTDAVGHTWLRGPASRPPARPT